MEATPGLIAETVRMLGWYNQRLISLEVEMNSLPNTPEGAAERGFCMEVGAELTQERQEIAAWLERVQG